MEAPHDVWTRLAALARQESVTPVAPPPNFASITSAAFAAWAGGIDLLEARASRLYQKFRRRAATDLAQRLGAAGFAPVVLKGLAAVRLYPDPDLRPMADVDLLLPGTQIAPALDWLQAQHYRMAPANARSPWGWVSRASLRPLVSPDGGVTVDLHVEADDWPLPQALPAEQLRRTAERWQDLTVPGATHMLVLAATHAARDLFVPTTAKGLADGLFLVSGAAGPIDWDEVRAIGAAAGLTRALRSYLTLLRLLGGPLVAIPEDLVADGPALRHVAARLRAAAPDLPTAWQKLRLELGVAAGPRIALVRNLRRLAGMVNRRDGTPS